MNEEEARLWCEVRYDRQTVESLGQFVDIVIAENGRQNLISPASCSEIWSRHIVDSAQLSDLSDPKARTWFDVGSGAGFPGMVIAMVSGVHMTLIEPRARRAAFLSEAAARLSLKNVTVCQAKAEGVEGRADVISARAVASLTTLIAMTGHLCHERTRLILPRGQNGASEVEQLPTKMRAMFHVEQSLTDAASVIVVADGVRS
ncbi:hypothetical protein ASE95_07005 [Sphingomonas sp. Leaf231]|uniref:16S rRNA (guanine(527)-N(7))-methyltransferase RsmG n=1 Tax=Sphingomonas sp. Leaf231 TaxID=1736301 RepID=UPI0007002A7A|nr:16S rRNA (guanine(527)-N(7))-methyltransferase RsmG [Sphingomonas sp. Leaf231]KQN93174.1 hypothetical protein ASE95_07005 [Sphingomonas sp. Leaf231]